MAWEPTQEYVLDLKGDLEGRYQARNDRIDGWRAMLRDEVDIQIPEAYRTTTQEIRLGLPRIWVRRTVGVLTSEALRSRCRRRRTRPTPMYGTRPHASGSCRPSGGRSNASST